MSLYFGRMEGDKQNEIPRFAGNDTRKRVTRWQISSVGGQLIEETVEEGQVSGHDAVRFVQFVQMDGREDVARRMEKRPGFLC